MSNQRKYTSTDVHRKRFLDAYRHTGNITAAARLAKIQRSSHYRWLEESEQYAEEFADAQEEAMDLLEIEARRRAVDGTNKPIYHKGIEVGTVIEYSDTLLIFLLKAGRPEKFRDRFDIRMKGKMEHAGQVHVYLPANPRHGDDDGK